jgi:CBS domain containing-hemolysin-like protein
MIVLTPIIFFIDKLARLILKILRINPTRKEAMTETELRTYVDVGHEDGVIETDERTMIHNVFDFGDTHARDVMIPRIDMVAVNADIGFAELMDVFTTYMYTRFPVYREDKDVIIGLVNIKDMYLVAEEERPYFEASDIIREGHYTHEMKNTADLLDEMRDDSTNMAFVLNEYGLTVGMITLEDLLEEIVGEIRDEYDEDEKELIQKVDDNTYLVEGSMKIDDINDALGLDLDSEDYDSIGGLMIESLVRLPEDGETVTTANGLTLKAQGISQNRISKVLMTMKGESD